MIYRRLLGRRQRRRRVFVLGLDGVPYSMLRELAALEVIPNIAQILSDDGLRRMGSVLPTVSSVAWTSYMTGTNPAKHNIFGFVDRRPSPFEVFIPTSRDIKRETLWEILSAQGRRVVVINVPISFPPRPVNGVIIGCFLTPKLEKGVYPSSYVPILSQMGYRIDVDASAARTEKEAFLDDLFRTLDVRFKAAFKLLEMEQWDFFQLHIMGTDRINHFFWDHWESREGSAWREQFLKYYKEIDRNFGELLGRLQKHIKSGDLLLIIMSDHGFCRVKKEFNLNAWLMERGYLRLPEEKGTPKLSDYHPDTTAYSLIPGRVFLNLQGREQKGTVPQGRAREELLERISQELLSLREPETGDTVIKHVYRREEIYSGPYISQAADMILEPNDGYDIKAALEDEGCFREGEIPGMHQREDAFLAIYPGGIQAKDLTIVDVMAGILREMGIEAPPDLDGKGWS